MIGYRTLYGTAGIIGALGFFGTVVLNCFYNHSPKQDDITNSYLIDDSAMASLLLIGTAFLMATSVMRLTEMKNNNDNANENNNYNNKNTAANPFDTPPHSLWGLCLSMIAVTSLAGAAWYAFDLAFDGGCFNPRPEIGARNTEATMIFSGIYGVIGAIGIGTLATEVCALKRGR